MERRIQRMTEAAVIIATVATIPIVIVEERGSTSLFPIIADWTIWAIFALDLVTDLFYASNRARHLRTHKLDITIVVLSFPTLPAVLALTRLVRLARVFRIVRLLRIGGVTLRVIPALQATLGRHELLYVALLSGFLIFAGGGLLSVIEPGTVNGSVENAIWWAVVTATTVGYGDIFPTTIGGRVVAAFVMLSGIGLISTLSASIAAYFVDQGNESALREIGQRLERIETMLNDGQAECQKKVRES